ncbi:LysR substrate-binding domain-containing protein [Mesorhizobium sp. BAC0120]|uniref:LysR substrate-binding domain-containing protein n=1 Tax=Mesorhizobium sp. BAC0120 TaxID=3090670 RepID=UPI00298CE763|nr:LysR substrate-binding domain-containing protein [Mesorhizobium sp. BAC0120]MDW6023339.1 LysR substrate-binding domain-containing protein [Mesorhizobium sp. BAC0120]
MKLNDLHFFVQVVDHGGFASASRKLGIPKSSISKRVAALEEDLGVRLIHRTTRQFVITDTGEDFYQHAKAALIEADAAEEAVKRRLGEPRGLVRVTASAATVQMALADLVTELSRVHPKIQIGLVTTNRYVDLVHENIDIAIRAHRETLPDSEYVQRRLGFSPNYLVASPDYLAKHGAPTEPGHLKGHFGIFVESIRNNLRWQLRNANGVSVDVLPFPKLFSDDPHTTLKASLAGVAIANLPDGLGWPHIQTGQLVRLLPDWSAGGSMTTILVPHRRGQLPSVRAVVEFIAERMPVTMRFVPA